VRATARAAGSIRGRLGGDTIIFACPPGPGLSVRAVPRGCRGDTGVAARACVLSVRCAGEADRPFLRSEACGQVYYSVVASCLGEVRRDWLAWPVTRDDSRIYPSGLQFSLLPFVHERSCQKVHGAPTYVARRYVHACSQNS
jgi:hypothetical protein